MLAAAREDEEAPPRADVRELDLLPLVLQVHLVGEAELDVVHQLRATGRLGRLGIRLVEVQVEPRGKPQVEYAP